jgi:hypothetical protein
MEELREPFELRFRMDLGPAEIESWEFRGFEECSVTYMKRNGDQ